MQNKDLIPIPFLHWRGFSIRLFTITIVPLMIFIVAIIYFSQTTHLREMQFMVGDRNLKTVRIAAEHINALLENKINLIEYYAKSVDSRQNPPPIESAFDMGLVIVHQGQNDFFESNRLTPTSETRNFFNQIQIGDQPSLHVAYQNTVPIGLIFVPLSQSDRIIVGMFNLKILLDDALRTIGASHANTILLSDQYQQVFYQIGELPNNEDEQVHSGIQEGLAGESGVNYIPYQTGQHIVTFSPIPLGKWALVMEETWENVNTSVANTTLYLPLILFPLLLLTIIALWYGARKIIQPLQKLQQQAEQLGQGDFQAINQPVGGIDEIKFLQENLITMSQELKSAQENLHQYIGSITDGIEYERKNLARELHDDTLQNLIAIQQRFHIIQLTLKNTDSIPEMNAYQTLVNNSIVHLRRTLRGLRPAYLEDLGLVSSLRSLGKEIQESNHLEIEFSVEGEEERLPGEVELAFYRICQEALNNILHHAKAHHVFIKLSFSSETVTLIIKDDGIGFDLPPKKDFFAASGHFGLLGMYERAELISAKLQITSEHNQGSTIQLTYSKNNL